VQWDAVVVITNVLQAQQVPMSSCLGCCFSATCSVLLSEHVVHLCAFATRQCCRVLTVLEEDIALTYLLQII